MSSEDERPEALLATEPGSSNPLEARPRTVAAAILRIGWPVVLSSLVQWSQSFFTIWLIGGAGEKLSMAAFGLANVVCNVTGHSLLWGIGAGIDTLASQAWGAKEHKAVGLYGQRAVLILTFVVNLPVVAIWLNATPILLGMKQDHDVAVKVATYARLRIAGLFCQGPTCVLMKTFTAMGKTGALLVVNLFCVAISLALSWLFIAKASPIARHFDPINGSALMSTIVDAVAALLLLAAACCDADCRRCWPGWTRKAWAGWPAYLRISVPAMLMGIFEVRSRGSLAASPSVLDPNCSLCPRVRRADGSIVIRTVVVVGHCELLGWAMQGPADVARDERAARSNHLARLRSAVGAAGRHADARRQRARRTIATRRASRRARRVSAGARDHGSAGGLARDLSARVHAVGFAPRSQQRSSVRPADAGVPLRP